MARVGRPSPHVYPDKRPEEYEDVYAQQAEDAPQGSTQPVEEAGGKVTRAHPRVGDPAREVLRLGKEVGAGLNFLGGRDPGPIERLVGGSVWEAGVKAMADAAGVECGEILTTDRPRRVIVEASEEVDADLIVVGSTGMTSLERAPIGSKSENLMRLSRRSVLLVREA